MDGTTVDEWDGDLTAKELERGVAAIICLVGRNGQDKEEGEKWYLWEGPLWRSVRPIFCSPTLSSSLFPAHPIFSPSLFLAHVHLSILMESPHPRPLREGGTEGTDNALTKGSKRAGTKQSRLRQISDS